MSAKKKKQKRTVKVKRLLIVAAVLFAVGLALCIVGALTARSRYTALFDQTKNPDGSYTFTYDFKGESVKKISLDVSYADVNIIGGAQENKLELINYSHSGFQLTTGATTLSLKEKNGADAFGIFSGFSFKGLRNLIYGVNFIGKDRTVNVYLTDDSVLKLLEGKVYSGNVNIDDLRTSTEVKIDMEYGSLKAKGFEGGSSLDVSIKEGNADIEKSTFTELKASLDKGYVFLDGTKAEDIDVDIKKGYFKYITGDFNLESAVLTLNSEEGKVRYLDDIYESGSFSQGMQYVGTSVTQIIIDVSVADGNIMITKQ